MTIRFTLLAITHIQGFSLSNSLIKKLYSADDKDKELTDKVGEKSSVHSEGEVFSLRSGQEDIDKFIEIS